MFNASNFEYLSEPNEKQLIYLLNRRIRVIRTHQESDNEGNDPQLEYIVHVINRNISNYKVKFNSMIPPLKENVCQMTPIKNIRVTKMNTFNWCINTEHEELLRPELMSEGINTSENSRVFNQNFEINIYKTNDYNYKRGIFIKSYVVEFSKFSKSSTIFWNLFKETSCNMSDMLVMERMPYLKLLTSSLDAKCKEERSHVWKYIFNECNCMEICTFI